MVDEYFEYVVGVAGPVLGIVMIVGSLNMLTLRVYPFAVMGSIAAMFLPFLICCVPGPIVGIWALVTLFDGTVKDAFWL